MKYLYANSFFRNKATVKRENILSGLLGLFTLLFVTNYSCAQQKDTTKSNKTAAHTQTVLANCSCVDNLVLPKKGTVLYQPITALTNYGELTQAMGWSFVEKEKTFKLLYFRNFRGDVDASSAQNFLMTIVAIHTLVKITHPDNTYTINVTPCKNDLHTFELPFSISRSYDILKYDRDFSYKDFDHTAQAYMHVLFLRWGLQPDVVLKGLLAEMIDLDGPKLLGFKSFIQTSNKKYHITIPQASLDKAKDKTYIPLILSALKAKYINPEEVINDEFVLTDPTTHRMNDKEKENLLGIIFEFDGNLSFSFDNIDKEILQPKYYADVNVKNIGIEISDKIIRSWDVVNKRPLLDSVKKPVPSTILAEIPRLEFSSKEGISAKIKSICLSASEISGTGILLNFDHLEMVDRSVETGTSFSEYNYPLFRIMPKAGQKDKTVDGITVFTFDTLITKFSGLLIDEAKISIPFSGDTLVTGVNNLIINNKLISGRIQFKLDQSQGASDEYVSLAVGNKVMVVKIKDLQQDLYNRGIKDLRFNRTKYYLDIFFKKTVL